MDPNQIPPELLSQILAQQTYEEQDSDLQNQMALAQEMRMKQGPQRYGAGAGALQAVADIIRAYKGRGMEQDARGQRDQLWQKRDAAKQGFADWYNQPMPQAQAPQSGGGGGGGGSVPYFLQRPPEPPPPQVTQSEYGGADNLGVYPIRELTPDKPHNHRPRGG